jgi:hypothetical protein
MSPNRSKDEKAAVIMRLRKREEETKKYGAPVGQALIIGVCGLLALAAGGYGPFPLRLDIFLQLSAVSILNFAFSGLCEILLAFLLKATNAPAALIAVPSIFVCLCVVLPYCVYIVPIIHR